MSTDSTALIPALRRAVLLKQSGDYLRAAARGAAYVAPAAAAATLVGVGTDWNAGAMTAAGVSAHALGHPLAGMNTFMKNRADTMGIRARGLRSQHDSTADLASRTPAPHVDTPAPVRGDFADPKLDLSKLDPALAKQISDHRAASSSAPAAFDPAALTPAQKAQYDTDVQGSTAAEAALKGRAPFSFTFGEKAPKPVRTPLAPADPAYQGALTGYRNARAEDVATITQLAAAKGRTPDQYLQGVTAAGHLRAGDPGRAEFDAFEKSMKAVNTRFNASPAPAESLFDRAGQPMSAWEGRVTGAEADFAGAQQARAGRDQTLHAEYGNRRDAEKAQAQQAYDQDPAFVAHQKTLADRQAFEAAHVPQGRSPADLAAERATIEKGLDGAHSNAALHNDLGNQVRRDRHGDAVAQHAGAVKDLPGQRVQADQAATNAAAARTAAPWIRAAVPVAAAGAGTLIGMTDTADRAAGTVGSMVKSVFTGDPKTDWLRMTQDYAPLLIGAGAVGALALWLMNRDDDVDTSQPKHDDVDTPQPKHAAVVDEDRLAQAARNRRRIEGLLARNPRALDNISRHGAATRPR